MSRVLYHDKLAHLNHIRICKLDVIHILSGEGYNHDWKTTKSGWLTSVTQIKEMKEQVFENQDTVDVCKESDDEKWWQYSGLNDHIPCGLAKSVIGRPGYDGDSDDGGLDDHGMCGLAKSVIGRPKPMPTLVLPGRFHL